MQSCIIIYQKCNNEKLKLPAQYYRPTNGKRVILYYTYLYDYNILSGDVKYVTVPTQR